MLFPPLLKATEVSNLVTPSMDLVVPERKQSAGSLSTPQCLDMEGLGAVHED